MNRHGVKALVVGAHAVAFHAKPRFTKDFDLFVEPSPENAARLLRALDEFGFGDLGLGVADFATPGKVVQLGVAPARVDLATSIDGLSFEQAWAGKVAGSYGAEPVWFIGRADLIRNKIAAGRPQDLADLSWLQGPP
ncbi:MAG: hypothetical protein ACRDH5_10440 [bacterium]